MAEEPYEVQILHFLSPHQLWLRPLAPETSGDRWRVEQVGVHGVLAQRCRMEPEINHMVMETAAEWPPAVIAELRRYFRARRVWFAPRHLTVHSHSIFDNNMYKLGEFYVQEDDDNINELSQFLKESSLAIYDPRAFTEYLESGKLPLKLSAAVTSKVLEAILNAPVDIPALRWKTMVHDQMHVFFHHRRFVNDVKEQLGSVQSAKTRSIIAAKEADFEFYCKGVDYEFLAAKDTVAKRKSVNRRLQIGEMILAQKNKARRDIVHAEEVTPAMEDRLRVAKAIMLQKSKTSSAETVYNESDKPKFTGRLQIANAIMSQRNKRSPRGGDGNHPVDESARCSGYEKAEEPAKMSRATSVEDTVSEREKHYRDYWRGDEFDENFQIPSSNDRQQHGDIGEDSFLDRKMLSHSSSSNGHQFDFEHSMKSLKFTPKQKDDSRKETSDMDSQTSIERVEQSSISSQSSVSSRLKIIQKAINKKKIQESTTECSEHETSTSSDAELKLEPKHLDKTRYQLIEKLKAEKDVHKYEMSDKNRTNKTEEPRKRLIEEIVERPECLKEGINKCPEKLVDEIVECPKKPIQENVAYPKKINHEIIKQLESRISDVDEPQKKLISEICYPKKSLITEVDDLDSPIELISIPRQTIEKQVDDHRNYEILKQTYNTDFIEKLLTPRLMIHSKNNVRIRPVTDLKSIHFTNQIHKILIDIGNKIPLTLQTVSWPCILRGYSFFTVNPKGSRKTMGYAPAVCRLVADSKGSSNSGPICIVMCDTAIAVDEVVSACNTFLRGDKIVLFCYAGVDRCQLTRNLLNGCDILVGTPYYLSQLFSCGHFSLDLSCLSIVVLDGCDRINQLYATEFKFFYSQVNKMLSIRVNKHHQIQYIATSNEWCNLMIQLAKKAPNSVVCFGAFHECVVYSKAHTSVVFDMIGSKVDAVEKFLKEVDATKSMVIVCNTNTEVAELEKKLTGLAYTVLTGGTNLSIQEVSILNDQWFQYELPCIAPILVCCDANLRHLNITNAHYLVHYSLPNTFASFCKRFAVLIDNYKSIFDKEPKSDVRIKILVDSENTEELPKLLNFMKRCTNNIPEVLNEISKKILIEKDKAKAMSYVPVCDNLLALGECPDFWYCSKRHTFCQTQDLPLEWVPKKGKISFKIIHYHSAVHYSAEVTSCTVNGKKTNFPSNESKKIAMKMNVYFCNEENRKLHGVPEAGDISAVSTSPGYFERCQVIRVLRRYDNGKPKLMVVNLIDEEKEHIVTDVDLFHLPERFKMFMSYVAQVRLGSVRPKDKDVSFSELSKSFLMRMLKKEEQMYLRANIALVVGNTIVVEDLEACQDMSTTSATVVRYRVNELLFANHAEPNEDHLPKLMKLCEVSGLSQPAVEENYVSIQKAAKQLPKPQWAHLKCEDFSLVYFSSAKNPGQFYVRLVQFETCLDNLTKSIQRYIDAVKDQEDDLAFESGDYVLAKFPDDTLYYRARIDYIPNKDCNDKLKCFFVDHGDWRTVSRCDVRVITESFITVLPFQAIECRLIGLKPIGEEWNDWSTNFFIEQCFQNSTDDSLKELYAKHLVKEPAESTNGNKYGIIMIDTSADEDIIINDVMLNANVAGLNEEEQHFLENINFQKQKKTEHSDSEDSDIIDDEWRKEAAPYKDITYERKLELPIESESPVPAVTNQVDVKADIESSQGKASRCSSFNADAFDIVFSDDECFEILGAKPKKPLLQLTAGNSEDLDKDKTPHHTEVTSSCSSYEAMSAPKIKELDSDDLSSSEYSTCEIVSNNVNIELVEKSKKALTKSSVETRIPDLNSKICDNGLAETSKQKQKTRTERLDDSSKADCDKFDGENNDNGLVEESQTELFKRSQGAPELVPLKSSQRTPKLSWHQTKTTVTIKIEISEIKNYKIDIGHKSLTFETYVHDTDYGFTITFYGLVDPEKYTHTNKGLYVLIKLTKLLKQTWLSLAEGAKKRWISYNPDLIGVELDEDDGDTAVLKKEFDEFLKEKTIAMDDDDDYDDILEDVDDIGGYS